MNLLLMIYQNICVSHTIISKRPCPLTIKFEIIILIISIVKVYFCWNTVKQMAEQHSFTSSRSTLHKNKLRRLLVCLPKIIIQNIRQSLYDRFLSSDLIIAKLMERRCFKQSGITNDLL